MSWIIGSNWRYQINRSGNLKKISDPHKNKHSVHKTERTLNADHIRYMYVCIKAMDLFASHGRQVSGIEE